MVEPHVEGLLDTALSELLSVMMIGVWGLSGCACAAVTPRPRTDVAAAVAITIHRFIAAFLSDASSSAT